jgi:hypothetical protein
VAFDAPRLAKSEKRQDRDDNDDQTDDVDNVVHQIAPSAQNAATRIPVSRIVDVEGARPAKARP